MTIEQAIKWCESRYRGALMPGATEAYKMCLAALRAQQQAEKNDPLTLRELKSMVGEPVYLDGHGWVLVGEDSRGCNGKPPYLVFIDNNMKFSIVHEMYKTYGKTAYRRKPEEDTNG